MTKLGQCNTSTRNHAWKDEMEETAMAAESYTECFSVKVGAERRRYADMGASDQEGLTNNQLGTHITKNVDVSAIQICLILLPLGNRAPC